VSIGRNFNSILMWNVLGRNRGLTDIIQVLTVHFKPGQIWTFAQDAPITSPGGMPGLFGPERGPSPLACSLGDVAARRRPAGYRQARARATWSRAAGACHPCPGTRPRVPRGYFSRSDAEPVGPRRCPNFTSIRGGSRGDACTRGARCPSRSIGSSATALYIHLCPANFFPSIVPSREAMRASR
jgi:hypothetical protein